MWLTKQNQSTANTAWHILICHSSDCSRSPEWNNESFWFKKTLVFTPLQTTFLTVLLSQKIFFVSMQSLFTSRANQKTFFSCINCMALISVQDYVCHVPTRAAAVKSGWASVKFHLRLPYKQGWSVSLTITPMLDSGNMCSCSHVTVLWLSESNWRLKKWGSVMTGRKVVKYL